MQRTVRPRSDQRAGSDLIDLTCTTHMCELVRFDGKFGCPKCSKEFKSNPWAGTLLTEYKDHMKRIKKVS